MHKQTYHRSILLNRIFNTLSTIIAFCRATLFYVMLSCLFIVSSPIWLIVSILPIPFPIKYLFVSYPFKIFTPFALCVLNITYEVKNQHYLKHHKPCIFVSNHQSAFETFILNKILYPSIFVIKKELLYIPCIGLAAIVSGMIIINRKNPNARHQIIEEGKERLLSRQYNVAMFPEGTRVEVGMRLPYKSTAFELAIEAGVDVIPIAHNAGKIWPRNSFLKKTGIVTFVVGKPIATKGKTTKALRIAIQEWTHKQLDELKG